jgi:hypothetical protein
MRWSGHVNASRGAHHSLGNEDDTDSLGNEDDPDSLGQRMMQCDNGLPNE